MRKTILLAMACLAAVMLTACGKSEGASAPVGGSSAESSSTVEASSQVSEPAAESVTSAQSGDGGESSEVKVSYKDMLPDIQSAFPNGTVDVIRSGMYDNFFLAQVKGYTESEYDAYVEACKGKGFTDVQFDIHEDADNTFEARTTDGKFYVSLQLLKDERAVLSITCGERDTAN